MGTLFFILTVGQIMNLYQFVKLNSWKSYPGLKESLYAESLLIRMVAEQHLQAVQKQAFLRLLGLFMFYGAIWGWIDIIRLFKHN
jgi:hypothetical protein